ncbi:hypothetical protein [Chondromyces crocatus]|uniref:Uncharacterized protein n=1 Tax=Chondromyces crocatus TaxID=52 RepID=A0A0K1ESM5_CHOCO|nr:hypothetical protein [Chondromyces crocatus]AKT43804.1 uncharacterized protein CMC5_080410 [Chondromyces crocatus]
MTQLRNISRPEKLTVARSIHANLIARQSNGPAEEGLDTYIPVIASLIAELAGHVDGKAAAGTEHQALLGRAELADIEVDTWYRHIERYLSVEANRRGGAHVVGARAVHSAACPKGLAHVDERIPVQNAFCRGMLEALRRPVNAGILTSIEFPMAWLDRLEAALTESEASQRDLAGVRQDKRVHVGLGRDAEEAWIDVMSRLRSYVANRAGRHDLARRAEGDSLLAPLRTVLERLRAEAAARKTRRENADAPEAEGPQAPCAREAPAAG